MKKGRLKSLTIGLAINVAVALLVYYLCEAKRVAERQILSYQTGHALSLILPRLQTPEGCSQVQTVLSNQLHRDLRVKYTDLSTIIQELSSTNSSPDLLNSQDNTN